jgi:hypothetical protein
MPRQGMPRSSSSGNRPLTGTGQSIPDQSRSRATGKAPVSCIWLSGPRVSQEPVKRPPNALPSRLGMLMPSRRWK